MPWTTDGRNQRASAVAGLVTAVSLHTADPSTTGANEWAGGGYARQTPAFGTAVAGTVDLSAPLAFTGPATTAASHVGLWAGATFIGGFARTSGDAAANAAGEYNVTSLAITAAA